MTSCSAKEELCMTESHLYHFAWNNVTQCLYKWEWINLVNDVRCVYFYFHLLLNSALLFKIIKKNASSAGNLLLHMSLHCEWLSLLICKIHGYLIYNNSVVYDMCVVRLLLLNFQLNYSYTRNWVRIDLNKKRICPRHPTVCLISYLKVF